MVSVQVFSERLSVFERFSPHPPPVRPPRPWNEVHLDMAAGLVCGRSLTANGITITDYRWLFQLITC